jgi:hypothetical protein
MIFAALCRTELYEKSERKALTDRTIIGTAIFSRHIQQIWDPNSRSAVCQKKSLMSVVGTKVGTVPLAPRHGFRSDWINDEAFCLCLDPLFAIHRSLQEHDLFGTLASTFPDHALAGQLHPDPDTEIPAPDKQSSNAVRDGRLKFVPRSKLRSRFRRGLSFD